MSARKSDQILSVIDKANRLAYLEWVGALIEEQAEPIRQDLAAMKANANLGKGVLPVLIDKAIEGPEDGRKGSWARMTPEARAERIANANAARLGKKRSKAVSGSWARMTPEERSAEMSRRAKKRKGQTVADALKLHPRDPRSPRHEAWVKQMSDTQKKHWATMSPYKKRQRQVAMQRGRESYVNGEARA